jgi:subtilisin family serine protease
VVAVLDTGCYPHYWFDGGVVRTDVKLRGHVIGYTDPATDPELHGDIGGPFDGSLDRIAGHGTFIAGLVHQACPDAQILSWRGIPADQPLVESEWLTTLAQVAELVRLDREGKRGGHPIDVLSLSMGYYHENEADDLLDPILWGILDALGRLGVVVVCSSGNDATDRPSYPAAFAPWKNGKGPVHRRRDRVPVVSVGALNPNTSDALFSNAGTWVRTYAPGASLMSTMPPFRGGLQPTAKTWVDGRLRESVDPDDFSSGRRRDGKQRGGFGVWSGTSFAAPLMAGAIASAMSKDLMNRTSPPDGPTAAVRRGWRAVERLTDIQRPE